MGQKHQDWWSKDGAVAGDTPANELDKKGMWVGRRPVAAVRMVTVRLVGAGTTAGARCH